MCLFTGHVRGLIIMLGWGLSEFDLEIIAGNMHSFEGAGLQNVTCPCKNVLQDIMDL